MVIYIFVMMKDKKDDSEQIKTKLTNKEGRLLHY